LSGEHNHPDYEEAIINLGERVTALETAAPPEPPKPERDYLWESDYTVSPWWKNHGVIGVAYPESHDLATSVVTDGEFGQAIKVDCLTNTVLDTSGTTYGFTDRCGFAQMGLCDDNNKGLTEFYHKCYFLLPYSWCDSEGDERWRTQSGSYKLPNTFGSFDPARGSGSQPYSNNFAALAWASNLGAIAKGPPSLTDYDRDRGRPSTFLSVAQAARQTRQPVPNGTKMSMIQLYYHLNPDPKDLVTGVGSGDKPFVFIERGVWHSVETYARTNSLGQANGEYKVWWDDDLVMWINDLMMGPSWSRGFNVWHNQYFHGGPSGLDTTQTMYLGPAAFSEERLDTF